MLKPRTDKNCRQRVAIDQNQILPRVKAEPAHLFFILEATGCVEVPGLDRERRGAGDRRTTTAANGETVGRLSPRECATARKTLITRQERIAGNAIGVLRPVCSGLRANHQWENGERRETVTRIVPLATSMQLQIAPNMTHINVMADIGRLNHPRRRCWRYKRLSG
jgi:hypothetical protein